MDANSLCAQNYSTSRGYRLLFLLYKSLPYKSMELYGHKSMELYGHFWQVSKAFCTSHPRRKLLAKHTTNTRKKALRTDLNRAGTEQERN